MKKRLMKAARSDWLTISTGVCSGHNSTENRSKKETQSQEDEGRIHQHDSQDNPHEPPLLASHAPQRDTDLIARKEGICPAG